MTAARAESKAFTDPRFVKLARVLKLPNGDPNFARGIMLGAWSYAARFFADHHRYTIPESDIRAVLDGYAPEGVDVVDVLVEVGLAQRLDQTVEKLRDKRLDLVRIEPAIGEVYLAGSVGNIEWLFEYQEKGRKGGQAKRANSEYRNTRNAQRKKQRLAQLEHRSSTALATGEKEKEQERELVPQVQVQRAQSQRLRSDPNQIHCTCKVTSTGLVAEPGPCHPLG